MSTGTASVRLHPPPRRRWRSHSLLWFLTPGLLIYTVFLAGPMVVSFFYSLTKWNGVTTPRFVGLGNYTTLFGDATTLLALRNTVLWTAVMVVVPAVAGLVLANALKGTGRWKAAVQGVVYFPTVLPMIGVAVIWAWIYNPQFGFLNSFLQLVGLHSLQIAWLGEGGTALPALMIANLWMSIGFPMVLYLAGIQSIPLDLYEAARVDGGGRWQVFRHVTLPGLRETHTIVFALEIIAALQVFAIIYGITAGGPGNSTQVLGTWMYANIFSFQRVGYGSAIGWVLCAMALAVTIPYVLWMTRGDRT